MNFLSYIKKAAEYPNLERTDFPASISIAIATNFTDDILKNIVTGAVLAEGIYPVITKVPYQQYHFALKNPASGLYGADADVSFFFMNAGPFKESAFTSANGHFDEVLQDIERYAEKAKGMVVIGTFITPSKSAYGNMAHESPLGRAVARYNAAIAALAARRDNVSVLDTDRIIRTLGEEKAYDLRGLYAFDIPFSHEFMVVLAEEWIAYIRAITGRVKKCIVVDLDNTLWGGVIGEAGPAGISLGPDYPGNAFVNFQRALLEFYERGIILAINSKNNPEDVDEAFEKNPYMVLKKDHFAALRINWNEKSENLREIAEELNIGLDSMVFIDDDPLHREIVKARFPEIAVPDFSIPPEEFVRTLYGLRYFDQLSLTEEDRQKGKMYADERKRKEVMSMPGDLSEHIAKLGITMHISKNDKALFPRISQLTLKTNQFNLTTRRYADHDIERFNAEGAAIYSGLVKDKFGDYGTVIVAIVKGGMLDTLLMSCRVMARGVECAFLDFIAKDQHAHGVKALRAEFIPTAKNAPAAGFLEEHGFTRKGDGYEMDLNTYAKRPCSKLAKTITITS